MAGVCDVTIQSDCPRNVVKLEQIMDASSDDDIWTLVESARGESLMEPRRLNLVVNREPSFFIFWTAERLDVPARGLLSRVMSVASRSHTALQTSEVSLERQAALPVNSQSAPPSARAFDVDGLSWVIDEPVGDMRGRAVSVTEDVVFLGDVGVHSRADGS